MPNSQLDAVHAKHGVPHPLRQCHMALVGGYVIEGHVPVDAIYRLLKEKPPVAGLVVQGMPVGSPGMEGPDPQPYEVLTFDRQGRVSVYARKYPTLVEIPIRTDMTDAGRSEASRRR